MNKVFEACFGADLSVNDDNVQVLLIINPSTGTVIYSLTGKEAFDIYENLSTGKNLKDLYRNALEFQRITRQLNPIKTED